MHRVLGSHLAGHHGNISEGLIGSILSCKLVNNMVAIFRMNFYGNKQRAKVNLGAKNGMYI